jgi:hypothetical protein
MPKINQLVMDVRDPCHSSDISKILIHTTIYQSKLLSGGGGGEVGNIRDFP